MSTSAERPSSALGARRQVVVDLDEGDLGLALDPGFPAIRADLLFCELLELLAGPPHVGDAKAVVGLRHPVKEPARRRWATGGEAHLLDHLVVLIEGRALEFQDDGYCHESLLDSTPPLTVDPKGSPGASPN